MAAKKKAPNAPAEKVELYDKLLDCMPEVERKGAANAYTSLNGHMFSFMDKTGTLSLRFSEEEKEAFFKEFNTGPSIQHNSVMRGYALVPDELLEDTEKLLPYFKKSYAYIGSLEPKPTKKKK